MCRRGEMVIDYIIGDSKVRDRKNGKRRES